MNDRDAAWHDLYKVKISTGERTLVRKNTERITAYVFDLKGQLRLLRLHRSSSCVNVCHITPINTTGKRAGHSKNRRSIHPILLALATLASEGPGPGYPMQVIAAPLLATPKDPCL